MSWRDRADHTAGKPGTAYRDGRVCKKTLGAAEDLPAFHLSLQSGCDTVLSHEPAAFGAQEYECGTCAGCYRYFLNIPKSQRMSLQDSWETDSELRRRSAARADSFLRDGIFPVFEKRGGSCGGNAGSGAGGGKRSAAKTCLH